MSWKVAEMIRECSFIQKFWYIPGIETAVGVF